MFPSIKKIYFTDKKYNCIFFPIHEKDGKLGLWNKANVLLPNFPNSVKIREIKILDVTLISYFVIFCAKLFRHGMFVGN